MDSSFLISWPLALNPPFASAYTVIQWLLSLVSKLDTRRDRIHLLSNFSFVAWSIWIARNKSLFLIMFRSVFFSVSKASSYAQSEYLSLFQSFCLESCNSVLQWNPPL